MDGEVFIVPRRRSRAWWEISDEGGLVCSLCGAAADTADLTACPGCGSNMTVDEEWTNRILERGYSRRKGE